VHLTFVAAIIGPGKVSPARVTLWIVSWIRHSNPTTSQRAHGRGKPSGDILSLTILRVAPGPMDAETLPQAAASSKARERSFDIDIA
jgi:hypothetical protein